MGRGKDVKPRKRREYVRLDPVKRRESAYGRRRQAIAKLKLEQPDEYRRRLDAKNLRNRLNHQADPEKARERDKTRCKRRRNTPEGRVQILVRRAKVRAREFGVEFDLHRDDIHIPTHCPVLGIPLSTEPGGPMANRFSLDRSDNSKGYVKWNVRVISYRANTLKGNATAAELRALAGYVTALEELHEMVS